MDTQSGEDGGGGGGVDVSLEGVSPNGGEIEDLGGVVSTMVTRLELSLACFSEKVANLSIFVMNLETLESELEAMLALEQNGNDDDDGMVMKMDMECIGKGLEFDLLCGVLDSEVKELGVFLETLRAEIAHAGERVSSSSIWKDKLRDCEQCLVQPEEQFCEIRKQSASFQRTLSSYKREGSGNMLEDLIDLFVLFSSCVFGYIFID